MTSRVDVLVVGGGLVGLSLACALKSSRLSILLLDGGSAPAPSVFTDPTKDGASLASGFAPRVSALSVTSRDFLSRIGGWPEKRVCAFENMLVWDGRGTSKIEFDAASIGEPALGYIVENNLVLCALHDAAAACQNVELAYDSKVSSIEPAGDGYVVTLESGQVYECDLLVGADGGNSVVRTECDLRQVSWNYGQQAMVSTIMTGEPHGHVARQCFTAEGPLAFLPLSTDDERLCSIVWSTAISESLMAMDDAAICKRLGEASEHVLGEVLAIDRRFTFPLRQQHLLRYVRPHLALVGDAAHTIHPLAGQGANLGFADARTLAVLLNDARIEGTSPGDIQLLRRYARMRQPANLAMMAVMEGFKHLYTPDSPAINWLRNAGTRVVDQTPVLKSLVTRLAGGR